MCPTVVVRPLLTMAVTPIFLTPGFVPESALAQRLPQFLFSQWCFSWKCPMQPPCSILIFGLCRLIRRRIVRNLRLLVFRSFESWALPIRAEMLNRKPLNEGVS